MTEPVREMDQSWTQTKRDAIQTYNEVVLTSEVIDFKDLFWLVKLYPRGVFDDFGRENIMVLPVIVHKKRDDTSIIKTDPNEDQPFPHILQMKSCTAVDRARSHSLLVEGQPLDLVVYFCPPFDLEKVINGYNTQQTQEINDEEILKSITDIITSGITTISPGLDIRKTNPFSGRLSDEFVMAARVLKRLDKDDLNYFFSRI